MSEWVRDTLEKKFTMPSGVYERTSTDKKGRGNPNLAKVMAEARKKQLEIMIAKKYMKPTPAAKLVDKNARTMAKLLQLLEIQARDKNGIVAEPAMQRRIDKLKKTISRRLTKLARYSFISISISSWIIILSHPPWLTCINFYFCISFTNSLNHYRWGDAPEVDKNFTDPYKHKNNYGGNIVVKPIISGNRVISNITSINTLRYQNTTNATSFDNAEEKTGEAEETMEVSI